MPEIGDILERHLGWEKSNFGPDYYFPSAASRPHWHLRVNDIRENVELLHRGNVNFLVFSHFWPRNLRFIDSINGLASMDADYENSYETVRAWLRTNQGQAAVDQLTYSLHPIFRATQRDPPPPPLMRQQGRNFTRTLGQ